jgi:hypothetical protein
MAGFAVCAGIGYWLGGTAASPFDRHPDSGNAARQVVSSEADDERGPVFRSGERGVKEDFDFAAVEAGALAGQRVLVFRDAAALEDFLKRHGGKVKVLGRVDGLHALRIGFHDASFLAALSAEGLEASMIFPGVMPNPPEGSVQPGAVPLGSALLSWLGVHGSNASWGSGVKIAVLDTGVTSHSTFAGGLQSLNFVPLPGDAATQNGHGTAVASLIAGSDVQAPGVAPAATLLSVRIAGDDGISDSFLLAQGILAALDQGASLINISMGFFGDDPLVRAAVQRALDAGVLVIAPTGNNGIGQVSYPAAYDGVIAVGGVDGLGNHLDFSNTGSEVDIAAPGYGVYAAWTGNQTAIASGTSFSAPIITGSIAAVMTMNPNQILTPNQAWDVLTQYLNDGGSAGDDAKLGAGMPDLGRVANGTTPGIHDAAVASLNLVEADSANPNGQIEVLVQNRGTENLINTLVTVKQGDLEVPINITQLAPNDVTTVRVPISNPPTAGQPLRVESGVSLGLNRTDSNPQNDQRAATYQVSE